MIRRLVFVFSILILISLSCVSANDLNETDSNDFDNLANNITATPENQTLNLDCDYHITNASQKHIVIDKTMTIDGNNHTIDAPDVSRVFWVKADNVVIKNINFINSMTTGLAGGAISWWGVNGTLQNCNFSNNVASSAGGAVSWRGDNGSITYCNFCNNSVIIDSSDTFTDGDDNIQPSEIATTCSVGGALSIRGNNLFVDHCSFLDNSALYSGGAIRIIGSNNTKISNSKFRNNKVMNSGGAISWQEGDVWICNSKFFNNTAKDLLLYSQNVTIINSEFANESCIVSYYGANYTNVRFGISSFDELSYLINITPEGGILVLDEDYIFINGTNKGILISKPITIDGAGHTLDGNRTSRMFNITADNVVIKNINFINGNAYGKYYSKDVGGGAIYWSGDNGYIENCSFTNNSGMGIEDDPFDKEEVMIDENGMEYRIYRYRPMGAKINEGGAMVWNGTNGTVFKCIFRNNGVGYPNSGGAISWRGNNGHVLESEFYNNDAWAGAAIYWDGDNGVVLCSKFINSGNIFGRDLMWFGKNGTVKYSFLITSNGGSAVYPAEDLSLDYNFWGDILPNTKIDKISNLNNCIVLDAKANKNFVTKGETIVISCNALLLKKDGSLSNFEGLNISGNFTAKADRDGFVQFSFANGKLNVKIVPKTKIVSSDISKYYKQAKQFKVRVYGANGKIVVGKYVRFTIGKNTYKVKTDKKGYATLKINRKPGKYTVITQYDNVKVKNKITVKTTLKTKDVTKKVKKSAKFKVNVLNSKGKAVAKKVVKIKFKGKTYKIKTNKKGIATFKVPKNLKVGKYTIKTTCNGLTNTNKIVVKR